MASAHYDPETGEVTLKMTMHETAGMEALSCRVGPETHRGVDDAIGGVFIELNALRDAILAEPRMARFWTHEFDEFRKNRTPLR